MTAFNEINGVPATGSIHLLRKILREWGFSGFVVSDWKSIEEMVNHGFCEDGQMRPAKPSRQVSTWRCRFHLQ